MRLPLVRVSISILAISVATLSLASSEPVAAVTSAPRTTIPLRAFVTAKRPNIVFTAVGAGAFLTLAKLLATADLLKTLKGPGPFTVFAPTDDAFAAFPGGTLAALTSNPTKLKKVLLYHVVPGARKLADLKAGELKTVEGSTLQVTRVGNAVLINGNTISAADIEASNGVVNVMDKVLLPPDL